jgi:hypothetical protein
LVLQANGQGGDGREANTRLSTGIKAVESLGASPRQNGELIGLTLVGIATLSGLCKIGALQAGLQLPFGGRRNAQAQHLAHIQ